jgi:autotransporter-associated beta strand protein
VAGGFTTARALTLNNGGGALFTSGPSATFAGIISGAGALTKLGATGTIILSRDNVYAGGTTIAGGVLQIGNGGTAGTSLATSSTRAT